MNKIIVADMIYTNSDETYYVGNGRYYQEKFGANSIEETIEKLKENGFREGFQVHRSDNQLVWSWWNGNTGVAIWDDEIQPYKSR